MQMNRVRNEEVHRRASTETVLVSMVDQSVLQWIRHMDKVNVQHKAPGVLISEAS